MVISPMKGSAPTDRERVGRPCASTTVPGAVPKRAARSSVPAQASSGASRPVPIATPAPSPAARRKNGRRPAASSGGANSERAARRSDVGRRGEPRGRMEYYGLGSVPATVREGWN